MTRSYSSFLFWLGLTIAASLMLYHTSDRVHELDQEMHTLNSQIEAEQQSLHVLNAEWVYLANPARIEAEAHRHLELQPTAPRRVTALQDIASLLPVQNGLEPTQQIQTAQATPAPTPVVKSVEDKIVAELSTARATTHSARDRVVAALNSRHINDHMVMQHTAAVVPSTDQIGALIGTLGLHP